MRNNQSCLFTCLLCLISCILTVIIFISADGTPFEMLDYGLFIVHAVFVTFFAYRVWILRAF